MLTVFSVSSIIGKKRGLLRNGTSDFLYKIGQIYIQNVVCGRPEWPTNCPAIIYEFISYRFIFTIRYGLPQNE